MLPILETLHSPELVVRFQRLCGLLPASKTEGKSVELLKNGDAGVSEEELKNGYVTHNLRSRTVKIKNPGETTVPQQASEESESTTSSGSESELTLSSDDSGEHKCQITNQFLYYLFNFGAALGNEVFYSSFFPYWFWNADSFVGRRIVVIWCLTMYFGQALKDVIRWPRPASPPVYRLEKRYALEYGMPSTHAMVGFGVPLSFLILTHNRYEYNLYVGIITSVLWCVLVCCSRIYLGMHSVLDVICGILCMVVSLPVVLPLLEIIDNFQLTHRYAPVVMVTVALIMCLLYPTLDKWSTARGDTIMALAVGAGTSVGSWVNFQYGMYHVTSDPPPYPILTPDMAWLGLMGLRTGLGIAILLATRTVFKALTYHLLRYLIKFKDDDMKTQQRLIIEIPYKFITYSMIAFNVVFFAPWIFRYLGIERITFHTEY